MPLITDPTFLGSLTIMLTLGVGFLAMNARETVHRTRQVELTEAIDLLRSHCHAMDRIDDDAMPESLLQLAVDISQILHDPVICEQTRRLLNSSTGEGPDVTERVDLTTTAFEQLLAARSDLAIAYIQALVTGLVAFERRWPDCAGKIMPDLSSIITSPMGEAKRIVRTAGYIKSDWNGPPVRAVAA